MRQHRPGRGDWLFIAAVLCAFLIVFWVLFGHLLIGAAR